MVSLHLFQIIECSPPVVDLNLGWHIDSQTNPIALLSRFLVSFKASFRRSIARSTLSRAVKDTEKGTRGALQHNMVKYWTKDAATQVLPT